MTTKNKTIVIIFFIFSLPFIVLASIAFIEACSKKITYSPKERLERLYSISLPEDMEVEYDFLGKTFTGYAPQYSIFKLKKVPSEIINKYDLSNGSNEAFEEELEFHLESLGVPKVNYPLWKDAYLYYGNYVLNSVNIIYFPDQSILIIYTPGH